MQTFLPYSDIEQFKEITQVKKLFDETFYLPTYNRWRINKEKAGKDIVGEQYEIFRKEYYTNKGLILGTTTDVLGSGVNTDTVILKNNEIVIVEEDKGSYVDGTFLKRAILDASTIFNNCIENNIKTPYFILSCSTQMGNYHKSFTDLIKLFRNDIKELLTTKFIYLPLCEHGRIAKEKYFKNKNNNFILSDNLIKNQEKLINKIIKEF